MLESTFSFAKANFVVLKPIVRKEQIMNTQQVPGYSDLKGETNRDPADFEPRST